MQIERIEDLYTKYNNFRNSLFPGVGRVKKDLNKFLVNLALTFTLSEGIIVNFCQFELFSCEHFSANKFQNETNVNLRSLVLFF